MTFPASDKSSRHPMHVFIAVTMVITLSLGLFLHQVLAAGNFGMATSYAVEPNPAAIALGDFNEDGILDMAVPSQSTSGTVSILYGDGHGGFFPAMSGGSPIVVTVQSGAILGGVLAKDLGNGHLDLVIAMQNVNEIAVLMGDGHGHFTPPTTSSEFYTTGGSPTNIVSADFNGDGFPDLAVTDQSGGVAILDGSTSTPGAFIVSTPIPTAGSNPVGIVSADFNGDGFPDLVVTNMGSNTLSFIAGGAGGTFAAPVVIPVPNGPWSVAAADFDGDGNQDVAVTSQTGNDVAVLLGDGHGGFPTSTTFPVGTGPRSIVVGNFGNGYSDIATANLVSNDVSVLLNDGHGHFTSASPASITVGSNPQYIVTGDFDGDGNLDLATADQGTNDVSVLLDATTVTNVTSSMADGTYHPGDVIPIQVTFNKSVTVDTTGGVPTLAVAVGSSSVATYVSGSGTNTLTFSYTVVTGDVSADLDYSGIMALSLNGGTIRDSAFNDAALSLPVPGNTGSLSFNKNIVIDPAIVVVEPVLTETVPVPTPGTNNSPSYTFTSDEAGTLSYDPSGLCGTSTTAVVAGANTINFLTPTTLLPLPAGSYPSCVITVTDGSANVNSLSVSPFVITSASGGTTGGGTTGGGGGNHGHPAVPYLQEITPVAASGTDHSPAYVFSASESGNISYGGSCSSTTSFAVNGVNSITFQNLPDGTYNSCTVTVTDLVGRANTLYLSPFKIYSLGPVLPPTEQQHSTSSKAQAPVAPVEAPIVHPVTLPTPTSENQPVQNSSPIAVPAPFQAGAPTTDVAAPTTNASLNTSAVSSTTIATPVDPKPVVASPVPVTPAPSTPVFGTEPNMFTPTVPASQGSGTDFASTPTTTLTNNNDCSVGSSSGVLGTVGDILKWGVCATGQGIAHLFGR